MGGRDPLDLIFKEVDHSYWIGSTRLPGITEVLKENSLLPYYPHNPEALRRGRLVHKACHALNENDLEMSNVPDDIFPYVMAFEKFKKQTGFTPLLTEKKLFHPTFMYAGTPDMDGIMPDGTKTLVEIKTGAIIPAVALQLAAQEMLLADGPRVRMALQLKDDAKFSIQLFKNFRDSHMFLSALALSSWRRSNGINVKERQ